MFEAMYVKGGEVRKHINVTPDQLLSILKAYRDKEIINLRVELDGAPLNCESLLSNLKL